MSPVWRQCYMSCATLPRSYEKVTLRHIHVKTCFRGLQFRNLSLLCRLVDGTDVSDQYTGSSFRLEGSSTRGLCTGTNGSAEPAASNAKGLSDQEVPSRITSLRFFDVYTLSKTSFPTHSQATSKRVPLYATGPLGFVSRLNSAKILNCHF
jgi:hypothetical protein